MFPVIDLGPIALQSAGLLLLLSLWVGIWLSGKLGKNLGTQTDAIESMVFLGLLGGILGARIGFLLQNPDVIMTNPLSILSLTPSMLNGSFGVLVGVITAFVYAQKKHLPLLPTLDTLSPLVLFIFAGLHLANLANGNAYGLPTNLPWGIPLWNEVRHPVQIYALIITAGLIVGLSFQTRGFKTTGFLRSGQLFLFTIAGVGLVTLVTRAFVAEKTLLAGIDLLQFLGFILLTACLTALYLRAFKPRKAIPVLMGLRANNSPERNLSIAINELQSKFRVRQISAVYKTKAVKDLTRVKEFHHQIIQIETDLSYPELMMYLQLIEQKVGGHPGGEQNAPISLDVLTYNGDVFVAQGAQIPDPDLIHFRYLAIPLAEIVPDFRHPASGRSIQEILETIEENSQTVSNQEVVHAIKE